MSYPLWRKFSVKAYDATLNKKLLIYGLPLASAAILEELTKSTDRFMLAAFTDKAQAGMYAVGYDVSGNSIFMMMTAINLAAYPVVVKLLETEGKQAARNYFKQYSIMLFGIAIPAVFGLILVGSNLVSLMIGIEYQATVIFLLPWMSIALFLLGLQSFYLDLAFQLGNYTIGIVKIGIFITLTNLILNYYLIPFMGIKGAAIATISSFALGAILSFIFGKKHFSLPFPRDSMLKIMASTLVMIICLWWMKDARGWGMLVIQLIIGGGSYFLMMLVFDILDIRSKLFSTLSKRSGLKL